MSEQNHEYIAKLDINAAPTAKDLPMALVLADRNERQSQLLGQVPEYAIELRRQHAFIQKMKRILGAAESAFLSCSIKPDQDVEGMRKYMALADEMKAVIAKINSGVYE